ncbi:UNVERIFIED_CONTAM: Tripartite motif containing 37 [Siphonaria sp. JEL0065]|nr:Tripartite motif containing 37 [Siphonaria sp. JEL0065]
MDDLAKQVRDIVSANLRGGSGISGSGTHTLANPGSELCKEHGAQLYYYCHSCQDAICSDCAVLANKHKDHAFEHLQQVYTQNRETLYKTLKPLFLHLQKLSETKTSIESQISQLHSLKQKHVHKHERLMQKANEHLERQFDAKCSVLGEFEGRLDAEVCRVQTIVSGVQRELRSGSRMDVIKRGRGVLEGREKDLCTDGGAGAVGMWEAPLVQKSFVSTLIPVYESSVMKIDGFLGRVERNRTAVVVGNAWESVELDVVYSNVFQASGVDWKLKVYCNGNKGEHLSVFMQMVDGIPDMASKYQYVIELVRQTQPSGSEPAGVKSIREFVSEFSTGECWGYTKFYPLDLISSSGFVNVEDGGSLEIKFSIRAMDFAQRCRDLQWRLDKMGPQTILAGNRASTTAAERIEASNESSLQTNSESVKKKETSSRVAPPGTRPPTSPTPHLASAAEDSARVPALPNPLTSIRAQDPPRQRSRSSQSVSFPTSSSLAQPQIPSARSTHQPTSLPTRPHTADARHSRQYNIQPLTTPTSSHSHFFSPPTQPPSSSSQYIASNYQQRRPSTTMSTNNQGIIPSSSGGRGPRFLLPPIDLEPGGGALDSRRRSGGSTHGRSRGSQEDFVRDERYYGGFTNEQLLREAELARRRANGSGAGVGSSGLDTASVWYEREAVEEVSTSDEEESSENNTPSGMRRSESNDEFLETAIQEATRRIQEQLDQVARAGDIDTDDESDDDDESWHDGIGYADASSETNGETRRASMSDSDRDGDEVVRETLNRFIERLASAAARDFGSSVSSNSSGLEIGDRERRSIGSSPPEHSARRSYGIGLRQSSGRYSSDEVDYEEMVERIERRGRLAAMLSRSEESN